MGCNNMTKVVDPLQTPEKVEPSSITTTTNTTTTATTTTTLLDDSDLLFCQQERLDQNSPELWPEQIPGVTEFTTSSLLGTPLKPVLDTTVDSLKNEELTKEDIEMLHEFSSLTVTQIMEKFHNLKNQAYQLGIEESREMTRGRFLNVLGKEKKK